MMRITALATLAVSANAAAAYCPGDKIVYENGDDTTGKMIVCGASTDTNCVAEGGKDAFCSLAAPGTSSLFPATADVSVCCTATDGPAYDVAQHDTCKECVEDNTATNMTTLWDGKNCFQNDGAAKPFPIPNQDDLNYIYGTVSMPDDCPKDCTKLGFIGTCWRRCGTRGWGVDPNQAYYGMQGYGGMGGYSGGYGGYGGMAYGMGYGGIQAYGMGYGGYGYGGYGYGGYGYGGYGYAYGTVPSAFGAPCPDPKMISMFPDAPTLPPMYYPGMGGMGYGMGYGMYQQPGYGMGYGMYQQPGYGMYQQPAYGMYQQPYNQAGYVGSIYGRQSYIAQGPMGNVAGAQYVGSIYGGGMGGVNGVAVVRPQQTQYVGSVYGTSSVYGGSVYGGSVYGGSAVAQESSRPRCDPAMQCSCDTKCCNRGDCCSDLNDSGCSSKSD